MLNLVHRLWSRFWRIEYQGKRIQEALGRIEARQLQGVDGSDISRSEFRVFSQWGEDGILQYLVRHVPISKKTFVEFGVENYTESNTRFLLVNNQWDGLVIDGSAENIDYIKRDEIYWRNKLKAVQAFISKENINELIAASGVAGEIGLLSIDIDGNDYWVWEAIDVIDPAIVVVEYNGRFGAERRVSIPYRADFNRQQAPGSGIYFGASLGALAHLGCKKGYALVCTNSAGNNAFFVKRSLKPEALQEMSVKEAFHYPKFRETRGGDGNLLFLNEAQEAEILKDLPLIEVA